MTKDNIDYIGKLREAVEARVNRPMKTPKDFEFLAETVHEELHQTVSPTTLKRLWGYLADSSSPRTSTLNLLSLFLGYNDWDDFCQKQQAEEAFLKASLHTSAPSPSASQGNEQNRSQTSDQQGSQEGTTDEQEAQPKEQLHNTVHVFGRGRRKNFTWVWAPLVFVLILVIGAIARNFFFKTDGRQANYTLVRGQKFETYHEYLRLFGISDTVTYWGKTLTHHPNIMLWGPEYRHPHWKNEGNVDSMMPTITERWEPADADSALVKMRNYDKYYHDLRLNEVRITFMKNLTFPGYIFLGVYRLSLSQSDTTHCVWERVSDECDLNHLDYLEELRN
ncbi:MAG: hypothetical protein K5764_06945 [Prevotella sp.]|nr:hypothetical protein [Prevotella sp.]